MAMIALTIALGASLATAMLNVMLDVGDKVNQELKTYGANITVVPKQDAVLEDLYEIEGGDTAAYLREGELGRIKTIFWAFNIVDFSPFLTASAELDGGETVPLVGTWFHHHLETPAGEALDTGVQNLRSWWDITEGEWLDEQAPQSGNAVMLGASLAQRIGAAAGDTLRIRTRNGTEKLTVLGVYEGGGEEDDQIYAPLHLVQRLSGLEGKVSRVEVSALTTPDNELAEKAAKDPSSLTASQYETWYCTAYVSSICYQIQEVITDSIASPVRQVADSEGAILEKTELLMILITILSLAGSALGISNLVTASVMERGAEIGLLKAIGAQDGAVTALVLSEVLLTGLFGAVAGYFAGFGFAQIIGQTVFGSAIDMKPMVIPLVAALVTVVTLAGSVPAVGMLVRLHPAEVLHGR